MDRGCVVLDQPQRFAEKDTIEIFGEITQENRSAGSQPTLRLMDCRTIVLSPAYPISHALSRLQTGAPIRSQSFSQILRQTIQRG